MPNALVFSPGLDGHRQVYVFIITHILEELGFKVFIAGNLNGKTTNSFYINKLKEKTEISILDTSHYKCGGLKINLSEFHQLHNECQADLTVFPEADHHFSLLISQIFNKNKRIKGRTVGIFMRPFYFYRPGSLRKKLIFLKRFLHEWNKDSNFFYEFFHKRFSLLDVSLTIDENFVNHHKTFEWLPDVFQKYADSILNLDEKAEQRIWIQRLDEFIDLNKGKFLFLYFGTAQLRRGYDTLLKLAEETGGCFIHCGMKDSSINFTYNTEEIISTLSNENRYFETNMFIEDFSTIEYFFKSITHLILPYQDFFGSSGVMLQALEYGIPVLGPDSGIIGYRIKKHNLGLTYVESDFNSLKDQFNIFKDLDPNLYKKDIESYMEFQSIGQLKNALVKSFVGSDNKVQCP